MMAGSGEALLYGQSRVIHGAAQAGLPAIDMPFVDVKDEQGCRQETRKTLALGFSAKMAIHPNQVPVINDAFTPTPQAIAEARRVVAALEQAEGGVILLDGKMVERPIALAMRRVLARTRSNSSTDQG